MPGFDPDQPRDEKGQWTAGSGRAAVIAAASDKLKILDSQREEILSEFNISKHTDEDAREAAMFDMADVLKRKGADPEYVIDAAEDQIRYQPFETMVIFGKDGNMIALEDGDSGRVDLDPKYYDEMRGGTLTHNHPHDVSFSNGDIWTSTDQQIRLKEIRAVGAGHDYIFRPNYNYQTQDNVGDVGVQIATAYEDIARNVILEFQNDILSGRPKMTAHEASQNFQHEVMKRLAKKTGSFYSSTPNIPKKDVPQELFRHPNYPFFPEDEEKLRVDYENRLFEKQLMDQLKIRL